MHTNIDELKLWSIDPAMIMPLTMATVWNSTNAEVIKRKEALRDGMVFAQPFGRFVEKVGKNAQQLLGGAKQLHVNQYAYQRCLEELMGRSFFIDDVKEMLTGMGWHTVWVNQGQKNDRLLTWSRVAGDAELRAKIHWETEYLPLVMRPLVPVPPAEMVEERRRAMHEARQHRLPDSLTTDLGELVSD